MSDLQLEIKHLIIESLGLEDMAAEDIAAALKSLPGWTQEGDALVKTILTQAPR
mgnify:CR=1 FL=1